MPATVTLSSTTLGAPVGPSDVEVKLASTSGVFPGKRLYVNGELMRVLGLLTDPWVKVNRGVDGTKGLDHLSGSTVFIGDGHQFYSQDPIGRPPSAIPVSPYINVIGGKVWFAQGDALPTSDPNRWWQLQTPTYGEGPLGVLTTTLDPTSST